MQKNQFDSQSEGPTMEPANSSVSKARANLHGLEKIKVSFTNWCRLFNKQIEWVIQQSGDWETSDTVCEWGSS